MRYHSKVVEISSPTSLQTGRHLLGIELFDYEERDVSMQPLLRMFRIESLAKGRTPFDPPPPACVFTVFLRPDLANKGEPLPMKAFNRQATPRRRHQIIFRLNDIEYEPLRVRAEQCGLTPNEFVRALARTSDGRVNFQVASQFDPLYIAQIKRIGNNLNQLVHNAHIFGRVSPRLEMLYNDINDIVIHAAKEQLQ